MQMLRGKKDLFASECSNTYEQFIHPIRKTTINTSASENVKVKINKKVVAELQISKCTRDLFGRPLYLSATNGMFCIPKWNN